MRDPKQYNGSADSLNARFEPCVDAYRGVHEGEIITRLVSVIGPQDTLVSSPKVYLFEWHHYWILQRHGTDLVYLLVNQ